MSKDSKTFIIFGIITIVVLAYSIYNDYGFDRQLKQLAKTVNYIEETVNNVRDGVGQQKQLLEGIKCTQSELNLDLRDYAEELSKLGAELGNLKTAVENLRGYESEIDGTIGSIIATTDELQRSIELTIEGIQYEGVEQ